METSGTDPGMIDVWLILSWYRKLWAIFVVFGNNKILLVSKNIKMAKLRSFFEASRYLIGNFYGNKVLYLQLITDVWPSGVSLIKSQIKMDPLLFRDNVAAFRKKYMGMEAEHFQS